MKKVIYTWTILSLFVISCEKNKDEVVPFISDDLIKSWEIVDAEGAPSKPLDTYSIWTFNSDGTYNWYFKYPDFYDYEGNGTYSLSNNRLRLTGILRDIEFVDTIVPIYFSKDKNSFVFYDIDGARFEYQIADTESEATKCIQFGEVPSYSGECNNLPFASCVYFMDGYVRMTGKITDVANCNHGISNISHYYSNGKYVAVQCYQTPSDGIVQVHHILNTNYSKTTIEDHDYNCY